MPAARVGPWCYLVFGRKLCKIDHSTDVRALAVPADDRQTTSVGAGVACLEGFKSAQAGVEPSEARRGLRDADGLCETDRWPLLRPIVLIDNAVFCPRGDLQRFEELDQCSLTDWRIQGVTFLTTFPPFMTNTTRRIAVCPRADALGWALEQAGGACAT